MLFFAHCDTILYCCDHTTVHEAIHNWRNTLPHRKAIGWSIAGHPDAALQINITPDANAKGCHADATWKAPTPHAQDMHFKFMLPFSDAASITNALHCVCQLLHMGYTGIAIKKSLKRISTVTMRLELKSGINNCIVINDSYNNDLHALRLAMDYATTQAGSNRTKTLLLSDVLQSGETDQQIYKKIAQWLTESQFTRLIAVGIAIKHIEQYLPKGFQYAYYPTTHLLLERFNQLDFHNECILIKGARAFQLERIAQRLQQKLHKTVLEVNLSALTHNLKTYLQLLRPETSLLVMVKASAYGSGSVQVAKVLEQNNVQYLGVAYADEGVELRQAGIKLPILVLNPEVGAFESMLRHQLEPEIYSLSLLHELVAYTGKHKKLSIHLKLDTGMHRLGFISEHLDELCGILEKHPNLQVKSIFSHLSSSGNPQFDAFTHQQAHTFTQLAQRISDRLANQPMRHIANTGGIVRFPEYHFEMVRLGIGLYGADGGSLQPQLQVVNTLKATISQIKTVHAGETVGYNRMGQIQKETKIATISIGYADGLLRAAGNGRYSVLLHQTLAPIVGNVCMDMTMIDVSHIPQAREGDEVIIFGTHPTVEDLAKALQTIPYEVFTNISERVKKVYWSE
ncbi:unnamed protein product [Darwinula stevensoni]|uniref:Alanine racemase C-terminal domain-containing protein n=1 Tax=Darwinula stevensoni TaxID=69355 RepID=A0A7R9AF51_9CRUS|nr:unnamed protein product [Darwinula stevensoni]CAG0902041.1 unnamed protein product [Darwinula stevensoni]